MGRCRLFEGMESLCEVVRLISRVISYMYIAHKFHAGQYAFALGHKIKL